MRQFRRRLADTSDRASQGERVSSSPRNDTHFVRSLIVTVKSKLVRPKKRDSYNQT